MGKKNNRSKGRKTKAHEEHGAPAPGELETEQIRRPIHPEIRAIDKDKGTIEYVASDETIDAYGEIVRANGWQFNFFKKNSPFIADHDYSIHSMLGRITDWSLKDGKLFETAEFARGVSNLADLAWKLSVEGYLKAVSVGFRPVAAVWRDMDGWSEQLEEMGLTSEQATEARVWRIFTKQEQLELSAVVLGANPNALAKAHGAHVLSDGDLASIGFKDAETFDFLKRAAAGWDGATQEMQDTLSFGLRAIHRQHSVKAAVERGDEPPETISQRGGDSRDEFLRALDETTRACTSAGAPGSEQRIDGDAGKLAESRKKFLDALQ